MFIVDSACFNNDVINKGYNIKSKLTFETTNNILSNISMASTCVCVRPVMMPMSVNLEEMTISFSADVNYFSLHDKNKQIFYMTQHSISRHSQLHSSAQDYVPPICRRLIIFDCLLTLTLNFLHF